MENRFRGIESPMVKMAIDIGSEHEVNLVAGGKTMPNKANGNCLYESIIDNINSRRKYFSEDLRDTPENYRKYWLQEGEMKIREGKVFYPNIYSDEQWDSAWETLQTTNQYDIEYFGEMAILSCAHSLRKDILIINTPWKMRNASAHGPINVVSSNTIVPTNTRSTEIPLVLAYDGTHFESLIPDTEEAVQKTVQLVKDFKTDAYKIPESLKHLFNFNKRLTQKNINAVYYTHLTLPTKKIV